MTAVMQSFNHHLKVLLIIVLKKIILWIFNQLVAQEVFGEISAGYTATLQSQQRTPGGFLE